MFILALRHLGTARTGAYYSLAFIGAMIAIVVLDEPPTMHLMVAGALMAIGLWLHLSSGTIIGTSTSSSNTSTATSTTTITSTPTRVRQPNPTRIGTSTCLCGTSTLTIPTCITATATPDATAIAYPQPAVAAGEKAAILTARDFAQMKRAGRTSWQ